MTPLNMARHRNSPHMAFWKMIKQGYDHFELTHLEPKVDVCEKALRCWRPIDLQLWPCRSLPGYRVPEQVAAAVLDKQRRDDIKTAELIMRGTPAAPVTFQQTDRD